MESHHCFGSREILSSVLWIGIYLYYSLALYSIANRAGSDTPWMAWVPILNLWYMVEFAGAAWYWFVCFFVPVLNAVAVVVVGIGVAQAIGKPAWMGALLVVPGVNLVMLGLMAWG